ncbi:MAG: DNA cytosine methyltransferase [Planctomycetota bacterium]
MRTIEFFAGIGGLSAACPWLERVASIDIDRDAKRVFEKNFTTPYFLRELESIRTEWLARFQASLWWLSPPCTPYSRRGHQRDIDDPRSRSLQHLVDCAAQVQPNTLFIENVVGFEQSRMFEAIQQRWTNVGYEVAYAIHCPSRMGWPNTRPRVYVMSSKDPALVARWREDMSRYEACKRDEIPTLRELLETDIDRSSHPFLWLHESIVIQYEKAIDTVDPNEANAVSACFASSYGKVVARAGSYLRMEQGYRRFTPREVASLLGFPLSFQFPEDLSTRRLWHLLGNSLSLPAVRRCMQFSRPDAENDGANARKETWEKP